MTLGYEGKQGNGDATAHVADNNESEGRPKEEQNDFSSPTGKLHDRNVLVAIVVRIAALPIVLPFISMAGRRAMVMMEITGMMNVGTYRYA
jgi:hypothetical protein